MKFTKFAFQSAPLIPKQQVISTPQQLFFLSPVQQYQKGLEFNNIGVNSSPLFNNPSPIEETDLILPNFMHQQKLLKSSLSVNIQPVEVLKQLQKQENDELSNYYVQMTLLSKQLQKEPKLLRSFLDYLRKLELFGDLQQNYDLINRAISDYMLGSTERIFPEPLFVKQLQVMFKLGKQTSIIQKQICDIIMMQARKPNLTKQRIIDRVENCLIYGFHIISNRENIINARKLFWEIFITHKDIGSFIYSYLSQIEVNYGCLDKIIDTILEIKEQNISIHHPTFVLVIKSIKELTGQVSYIDLLQEYFCFEDDALNHSISSRVSSNQAYQDLYISAELEKLEILLKQKDPDFKHKALIVMQHEAFKHDYAWKVFVMLYWNALYNQQDDMEQYLIAAFQFAPQKHKPIILQLFSRLYRYQNRDQQSLDLLESALREYQDWRIASEYVNLMRLSKIKMDFSIIESTALMCSNNSKVCCQLIKYYQSNQKEQFKLIRKYLLLQPKSGDLWLEAARYFTNPFYDSFCLNLALQCLQTALIFTPQNGDIYLEYFRVSFINKLLNLPVNQSIDVLDKIFIQTSIMSSPSYGDCFKYVKELVQNNKVNENICNIRAIMQMGCTIVCEGIVKFSQLYLQCQEVNINNNTAYGQVQKYFVDLDADKIEQWISGYPKFMFSTGIYSYDYFENTHEGLLLDVL
ncbi:Conserved_hypothetical protein [Hexamita inflata]|uniref:Uncharacterized protein n=1 Tax=Hexamita inflata TaxID=28002 RepID=A0AA86QX98_9EUKA|nr:Conserved hypothetical protein [Hexamita inflata]